MNGTCTCVHAVLEASTKRNKFTDFGHKILYCTINILISLFEALVFIIQCGQRNSL